MARSLLFANRFQRLSRSVYDFREESALIYQLALVVGFAGLTGLAAQVSIVLPFTPVPVTGQVFSVLVAAAVLGRWLGPASQIVYVGLGAVGLPWFAPSAGAAPFTSGGFAEVVGVTGGYLIGFIVAAAVMGWILDRGVRRRSFSMNLLVLLLGIGIIYLIGSLQLALILHTNFQETLLYGVIPFLPGDMLKAMLAAIALVTALPPVAAAAGNAESWPSGLRRRDYAAVAGTIGATWSVVALLVAAGWAPTGLLVYYVIAAAACSGATVCALGIRESLARSIDRYRRGNPTG